MNQGVPVSDVRISRAMRIGAPVGRHAWTFVLATILASCTNRVESGTNPWRVTAQSGRGSNGQRLTMECPASGTGASVWGTDIYTDDSSVCTAAVHAGLITFATGGTVEFEILAGESAYCGSTRNGVTSQSFGRWTGSFAFPAARGTGTTGCSASPGSCDPACPSGSLCVRVNMVPTCLTRCQSDADCSVCCVTTDLGDRVCATGAAQCGRDAGTDTGSQPRCTDLTACVSIRTTHPTGAGACTGRVSGWLTNNCSEVAECHTCVNDGGTLYDCGLGTYAIGREIGGDVGGIWGCGRSPSAFFVHRCSRRNDPTECRSLTGGSCVQSGGAVGLSSTCTECCSRSCRRCDPNCSGATCPFCCI